MLAVIPLQLCLALVMAMMVQKLEKGRDIVLWILIIPLGISDLAAGLVWLTILQDVVISTPCCTCSVSSMGR